MIHSKTFLAVTLALAASSLATAAADARGRNRDYISRDGFVTAESRFGNGVVSAPVRDTRRGPEVRLPSGTWIGCRRSCTETLRVQTVDFYETDGMRGYGTADNECGVFGCLDVGWPRRSSRY
jgi:hypothetical protein